MQKISFVDKLICDPSVYKFINK